MSLAAVLSLLLASAATGVETRPVTVDDTIQDLLSFSYVASLHEGFPYAVAIRKHGLNAFVLKYRVGSGAGPATRDLAAAISHVFRNAKELGVGPSGRRRS